MTALAAMSSTVATPIFGASVATTWLAGKPEPRTMAATRSSVGGMASMPSPQPWSMKNCCRSAHSSLTSTSTHRLLASFDSTCALGNGVVSLATISSNTASTLARTCGTGSPPSGCGMMAVCMFGRPKTLDWLRASAVKGAVINSTAGRPSFSASTESWTLHDVQDPQSPKPVMTTSQLSFSACIISGVAGTEAAVLET